MRVQSLVLSSLLLLVAGCDRETAPLPFVEQTGSAAQSAIAASRTQSFDLEIKSVREGELEMTNVLHVSRQRTGAGWRTSIKVDPTPVPAGQQPVRNEIVSVEIDEHGNQILTTNTGRQFPMKRGRATINRDLKGLSISEASNKAGDVFDILPYIVYARSDAQSRLARLERSHPGQASNRGGRIAYTQAIRGIALEFEYDGATGLALRSKSSGAKGASTTVEHFYREVGDLIVRTSSRSTVSGSPNRNVSIRTLTHVAIDGKEIIP